MANALNRKSNIYTQGLGDSGTHILYTCPSSPTTRTSINSIILANKSGGARTVDVQGYDVESGNTCILKPSWIFADEQTQSWAGVWVLLSSDRVEIVLPEESTFHIWVSMIESS